MTTPTATQSAHAASMLARNGTGAKAHELDQADVDIPILIIKGLPAKHRIDVDIWGDDVLGPALRRVNPHTRFVLWVRGDVVGIKTNLPLDVVANAVVVHLDHLKHDISKCTVSLDPVIAERATLLHEDDAK